MSFKSSSSTVSQRNTPFDLKESCYQYALRCAYLVYLCQPKQQKPSTPSAALNKRASTSEYSWSNAVFSIGDIFGKSASAKFPKDLIKQLGTRIELISKGQDVKQKYNKDSELRAIMGVFYGNYNNPSFQRQLKENRKIEELILSFVTCAQGVLKKRSNGSDVWKEALMQNVASFVELIRDVLRSLGTRQVSKELVDRIDSYLAKLGPTVSSSTTTTTTSKALDASTGPTLNNDVLDTDLVKQIGVVFNVPRSQMSKDVAALKGTCTEKAALRDLKTCISNVNSGARFPGRREDFDSDDAYQGWRKSELDTLQQIILALATVNRDALGPTTSTPERPANTSRPSSMAFSPNGSSFLSGFSPLSASTSREHARSPSTGSRAYDYFSTSTPNTVDSASLTTTDDQESLLTRTATTLSSIEEQKQSTAENPAAGFDFVYIPPNPQKYYTFLLETCLDEDLAALKNLDPDAEVSLRILSKANQALLSECGLRWRLTQLTRSVCFVQVLVQRYIADQVSLVDCVNEALADLESVVNQTTVEWDSLRLSDRTLLSDTLSDLFDTIIRRIYELVQHPEQVSKQQMTSLKMTLDLTHWHPIFVEHVKQRGDYASRVVELQDAIRILANHKMDKRRKECLYIEQDGLEYVKALLATYKWLKSSIHAIDRLFPEPLLPEVDVTSIWLSVAFPLFFEDLYAANDIVPALLAQPNVQPEEMADREAEIRSLYEGCRDLVDMHQAFCPEEPTNVDFRLFEPLVDKWLDATSKKTLQWVNEAISVDKFVPEGQDHHSSSIVDVIESCKSAVAFIANLKWPDEFTNAVFYTRLSQTIAKAIEQYCSILEGMFMNEMFPPLPSSASSTLLDPESDERTSAWLVRAKGLVSSEKKVEPFSFQEATLVKLNNIQAARDLLDKLYKVIDVDRISSMLKAPSAQSIATTRSLFTIKIVLGENLIHVDESDKMNPFLTLSDRTGHRLAKTRTLYNTVDPRWAETFDLSIEGAMWLAVTVYHRNLVEEHRMIARGYIHLNPAKYSDFFVNDVWVDLKRDSATTAESVNAGRCLVRISMEGEKDDIAFYFGRCFRSLKRTETDMIRFIVDKMSPMIRHSLSRPVLKSLLKKGGFLSNISNMGSNINVNVDMVTKQLNEKIKFDKIKAMFGSSTSGEIPPIMEESMALSPAKDDTPTSKRRQPGLTDAEIEDAIGTLFEYFEDTFSLLKETLNDTAFGIVMQKIWKEILTVIESLLVPAALSDQPSDMRPLNDKEVYIAIRWLKGLSNFFFANGEGVPIEDLHNARFRQLLALPLFYDLPTDDLMMECNRSLNAILGATTTEAGSSFIQRGMSRTKSVYHQRNLGTIRHRKTQKRKAARKFGQDMHTDADPEIIMRILRMRPHTQEFLAQQLETLRRIQTEAAAQTPTSSKQPTSHGKRTYGSRIKPPVPSLTETVTE